MKLYEVTTSLQSIWAEIEALLDGDDQAGATGGLLTLEQRLKSLEGTHAAKCLDIACLIKNLEAEAEAIKEEETKLSARRKSNEKRAEWLRAYLSGNMEPGTNLKDARAVIGWRKSMAVEVECKPEDLPESLRRTKVVVEADKAAIKSNLEAGQTVSGCALVTRYNLQIK